ncbi:hypothetical protein ABG067_006369 [Albugo candida]
MTAPARNWTPSMMKRVGGGYVLRAQPTDTSARPPTRQRAAQPVTTPTRQRVGQPTETTTPTSTRQRAGQPATTPIPTRQLADQPATTTIPTRTARVNAPLHESASTTVRASRTTSTRTISTGRTSTLTRVPGTNAARATAQRRASPVMTRGSDSVGPHRMPNLNENLRAVQDVLPWTKRCEIELEVRFRTQH